MFKIDAWYDNAAHVKKIKADSIDNISSVDIILCKYSDDVHGKNFNIQLFFHDKVKGIVGRMWTSEFNVDFKTVCFQILSLAEVLNVLYDSVMISFSDFTEGTEGLKTYEIKREFYSFLEAQKKQRKNKTV